MRISARKTGHRKSLKISVGKPKKNRGKLKKKNGKIVVPTLRNDEDTIVPSLRCNWTSSGIAVRAKVSNQMKLLYSARY